LSWTVNEYVPKHSPFFLQLVNIIKNRIRNNMINDVFFISGF